MPEPVQWVEVPGWGKCVPLAEVQAIAERLDRERKARHAAEAVNAEEVLRRRTNLEARIESAEAEVERLRRGVGALVATTRCLRRPDSKLDVDPGACGCCAPCLAKQAYYGDDLEPHAR